MSFGYLEASMKGRKTSILAERNDESDRQKRLSKPFLGGKLQQNLSMHFHQTVAVIWSFLIQVIKHDADGILESKRQTEARSVLYKF